jgi:response regulator of citrate/malate metabolism
MATEIDPVKYGVLWQKVQDYERRFDEMSTKIDKLEKSIDQLVALANQSKGGFWMGMAVVSALSSVIGWLSHWFSKG